MPEDHPKPGFRRKPGFVWPEVWRKSTYSLAQRILESRKVPFDAAAFRQTIHDALGVPSTLGSNRRPSGIHGFHRGSGEQSSRGSVAQDQRPVGDERHVTGFTKSPRVMVALAHRAPHSH